MNTLEQKMPNTPLAVREFIRAHLDDTVRGLNGKPQPLVCSLPMIDSFCRDHLTWGLAKMWNNSSVPWVFSPAGFSKLVERFRQTRDDRDHSDVMRIFAADRMIVEDILLRLFGEIYNEKAVMESKKVLCSLSF